MLDGYKTYVSGVILFLGFILQKYASQDEVTQLVTGIVSVVGLIGVFYGRYKATKIYGS